MLWTLSIPILYFAFGIVNFNYFMRNGRTGGGDGRVSVYIRVLTWLV